MSKTMSETIQTTMPWANTDEWIPGDWYPMPIGYMGRSQDEYIIDGYEIFELDPDGVMPGDISVVFYTPDKFRQPLTFTQALALCEIHNNRRMIE